MMQGFLGRSIQDNIRNRRTIGIILQYRGSGCAYVGPSLGCDRGIGPPNRSFRFSGALASASIATRGAREDSVSSVVNGCQSAFYDGEGKSSEDFPKKETFLQL
jgi:hypothetical protein